MRRGGGEGDSSRQGEPCVHSENTGSWGHRRRWVFDARFQKHRTRRLATNRQAPMQTAITVKLNSMSLPVCIVLSQVSNNSETWVPRRITTTNTTTVHGIFLRIVGMVIARECFWLRPG